MHTLANIDLWTPSLDDLRRLGALWPLAASIIAVLIGALVAGRNWRVSGAIAAIGAALSAFIAAQSFHAAESPWAGMAPASPDAASAAPMIIVDSFSHFFTFFLSMFLLAVIMLWFIGQDAGLPERLARRNDAVEFFVLFLGSAFGMALMVSTTNLLMIILAVESASLPSYGLAGFRKKHRLAAEASLKYILFGAVTSAIMIYGASLLYGQFHTLDLAAIASRLAGQSPTLLSGVALFAFLVGIAFKISAVPFHFWCPDVFEGASIEVTTWLSVASKAAGLGLMLRIITVLGAPIASAAALENVRLAIAIMAAITCTVGNLSAFRQTNLKRLLAFSSIAHAGYMLMIVPVFWRPADLAAYGPAAFPAFSAIAFYLMIYLLMNLGAFAIIALVYWQTGKETIDAFNGLARRSPLLALAMVVCLFSLVGLPPMGGFIAKWWLLIALYQGGLIWLIFVAVFNTLISLYYYARIAYAMYFVDDGRQPIKAPILGQALALTCALLILLSGTIYAGSLKKFADEQTSGLYAGPSAAPPAIAKIEANSAIP